MLNRILFFVLISCSFQSFGQITFSEETKVQALMQRYESEGKAELTIEGWRIKIVSTTDRRKLENVKALFEREYSEYSYSTSYENPYYSLKVGAYETRYDLEPHLARFKIDFKEAIPFRDRIDKTELFDSK